jgi:predicted RNase H-related nuclease YkuK (DUF458 family)
MEKYFRTQQGERVNIVEHTLDQLQKWPNLKMYIGTDSQDYGAITRSVTVVVYRYGHRGAHFVYFKYEVPRVRDMIVRLLKEAQDTLEAANLIDSEIPVSFESLDFDFNTVPRWASNKVLASVRGWIKGMNYNATFKGEHVIATKAADHVCRHPEIYK